LDGSRGLFDAVVREPAAEPAARLGLGRIAAAQGRHDEAVAHLQRAIELYPEWGAAYYALALSYRALGRRADAQRALERQAQYGPRWPAMEDRLLAGVIALRDDAQTKVRRGVKLAETGELEGGMAVDEGAQPQE